MAPPTFGDLGKQSKDVFGKGYHFGMVKLDVKTKTESGVEFNTSGSSDMESGKVSGNLETKYKVKEFGVTITEKWNTNNTLNTVVDVQDLKFPGLKLSLDTNFSPATGSKNGVFKAEFKHETACLNADIDLGLSALNASATVGHGGWLAGYQTSYDIGKSALTKNNFGVGYSASDFVLHTSVANGSDFGASVFQKVNKSLETGVSLGWSSNGPHTSYGIGAKYALDDGACVRAKINNKSELGLSYQQNLRDGVKVTLSTLVNTGAFNTGGHKLGLAIEMEA